MRGKTIWGIILVIIGLSILFNFPFFNVLFAALIIWFGVRLLSGKNTGINSETKRTLSEDFLNRVLIFSGMKVKLSTKNFKGGELVTVFGGTEVDASSASSKEKNIIINTAAIFGGIKIRVPKDWQVESEGVGIFGGYGNSTVMPSKPAVTLHIKGAAIFGGVEIVN